MYYKTFTPCHTPIVRDTAAARMRNIRAFSRALFLTLVAAGFAAGMLYVAQDAASYSQSRIAGDIVSDDAPLEMGLSALWRVVGHVSPYLTAAVRLLALLCAFFAFVARLLFG